MARADAPPAPRASLRAVHLFGSALDGGLKPYSDIDLLVTVGEPDEATRRRLARADELTAFIRFVKSAVSGLL
jgi:predicted nucleotidyltransferase